MGEAAEIVGMVIKCKNISLGSLFLPPVFHFNRLYFLNSMIVTLLVVVNLICALRVFTLGLSVGLVPSFSVEATQMPPRMGNQGGGSAPPERAPRPVHFSLTGSGRHGCLCVCSPPSASAGTRCASFVVEPRVNGNIITLQL